MERICKNCKYGHFRHEYYGYCTHPKLNEREVVNSIPVIPEDGMKVMGKGFIIGRKFGCIHWEEK